MTEPRLRQVEAAEAGLRDLGISGNLRVRYYGTVARVEIDRTLLPEWQRTDALAALTAAVRAAGFDEVELDPRGFRSGGLNVIEAGASLPGH